MIDLNTFTFTGTKIKSAVLVDVWCSSFYSTYTARNIETLEVGYHDFTRVEDIHAVAAKTHTHRRLPVSHHDDAHGGWGSAPVPAHTRVHADSHTPMTRSLDRAPAQTQQMQLQLRMPARPSYENTDPYLPHQIRSVEVTYPYPHSNPSPLSFPHALWSLWRRLPLHRGNVYGVCVRGVGHVVVREVRYADRSVR